MEISSKNERGVTKVLYKLYLINRFLYLKKVPLIPKFLTAIIRLIFSAYIPPSAKIGTCLFGYGGLGIVIHNEAIIGDQVIIGTNVTIGGKSEKTRGEVPVIGNRVYIASGAKILGGISIGDNSIIGANAVVMHNVPRNSMVGGIPGKVLKENIEIEEYVNFEKFKRNNKHL